jgi:hypothetical protein
MPKFYLNLKQYFNCHCLTFPINPYQQNIKTHVEILAFINSQLMQASNWVRSTTQKTLTPIDALKSAVYLHQGCTNPGNHVTVASKFCTVTPNIFVLNVEFSFCVPSGGLEFLGGLEILGRFVRL